MKRSMTSLASLGLLAPVAALVGGALVAATALGAPVPQDLPKAPDVDFRAFDEKGAVELHVMVLDKAGEGGAPVTLRLWCRGGRFGQGWAETPQSPGYCVPVMAANAGFYNLPPDCGLERKGSQVTGAVYQGAGTRFVISAAVSGDTVTGTYQAESCPSRKGVASGEWSKGARGQLAGKVMSAADLENTCPPLAAGAAYPCWRNDGSGVGFETGSELVSDPSQAKIVWKSEELVPCGYHEGINLGTRPCGIQTGHASPVLAEDRVFMSWFVGSPGREADDRKGFDDFLPTSLHVPPEMIAKKIARVADQIVTCMDARTGRTLWRAVVKEGGPNISRGGSDSRHKLFGPSSKAASHLTPCAAYGKVFAKGTGNILYAFDAATGKLLWQTGEFDPRAKFWGSGTDSVTFADGVVATGLGELSGFDHGSGRKLWGVKGATGGRGETHIRWVCKGKEFFIAPKGQCLEPKTGKVLWTAEGAPGGVIAADESRLVFGHSGSIVAYRVSPQGAEKLWSTTDHLVWRTITPVVYRGAAFVRAVTPAGAARSQAATYCFDVETGMVLGQATGTKSFSSVVAGDGRIFNCNAALVIMQTADPKDFRDLKATGNAPSNTVADVSMPIVIQGQPETTAIYADGRIFTRCFDGVICMDLRAAPAHDGRKGTAPTPGRR